MNDEATPQPSSHHARSSKLRDGLILLVEDNVDDVELTLRAFKRRGFTNRIVTLRDGVQALDYLKRRGSYRAVQDPPPALVLLDLKLPRVDGLEVLEEIKADPTLKTLPVVMLTSSMHERDLNAAYRLGANSYICKPTEFSDLLDVVDTLENYWFGIVELPPGTTTPVVHKAH